MGAVTFALSGKNLPSSTLTVAEYEEKSSVERCMMLSSSPPKPDERYLPATLTVPRSESWTFILPCAAHPPSLFVSLSLSSLTQTSPAFISDERFLTPITMVFTSPRVGLPMMEMRLFGLSSSYAVKTRLYDACPELLAILRSFLSCVKRLRSISSILSSGHTARQSWREYWLYLPAAVSLRGISYS